jgi:hypothetical protein
MSVIEKSPNDHSPKIIIFPDAQMPEIQKVFQNTLEVQQGYGSEETLSVGYVILRVTNTDYPLCILAPIDVAADGGIKLDPRSTPSEIIIQTSRSNEKMKGLVVKFNNSCDGLGAFNGKLYSSHFQIQMFPQSDSSKCECPETGEIAVTKAGEIEKQTLRCRYIKEIISDHVVFVGCHGRNRNTGFDNTSYQGIVIRKP